MNDESLETMEQSEKEAQTQENVASANAEDESTASEETKELTLEEKYAELEAQYTKVRDDYLRKAADFDNYRKRMIKEKQDAFDYANTAILTDLVAILDDFDRGLDAASNVTDVKAIYDGMKMINKQMHGFLDSKYNLTSYCEKGDAFDPNIHEAIASVPADVAEPVCAEVYLKGYKLKERIIRPAKVMVHMPSTSTANDENGAEDASTQNADASAQNDENGADA